MSTAPDSDPVVLRELPLIRKIQRDEIWLEGERRGYCVPPGDPAVRESVCLVILRIGAQMRAAIMAAEVQRAASAESPRDDSTRGPSGFGARGLS